MIDVTLTSFYDYIVLPEISSEAQYTDLLDDFYDEFRNIYYALKSVGFSNIDNVYISLTDELCTFHIDIPEGYRDEFFNFYSKYITRRIYTDGLNGTVNIVIMK